MKRYLLLLLTAALVKLSYAQKVPKVQEVSLFAPANVKIDGNHEEWGAQLQADNSSIEAFYTIANDNDNLYLIVKAQRYKTIDKVLGGGITLNVFNDKKQKANTTPFSLTFPVMTRFAITDRLSDTAKISADELLALNKTLSSAAKIIEVTGADTPVDTMLSVYNEHNIKVAHSLAADRAYTLEISVPLKYLKSKVTNAALNYSIVFNGIAPNKLAGKVRMNGVETDPNSPQLAALVRNMAIQGNNGLADLTLPTSVSEVYKLAIR